MLSNLQHVAWKSIKTGSANTQTELSAACPPIVEQDAGFYRAARSILDEGQAYLSALTQQKVMDKV